MKRKHDEPGIWAITSADGGSYPALNFHGGLWSVVVNEHASAMHETPEHFSCMGTGCFISTALALSGLKLSDDRQFDRIRNQPRMNAHGPKGCIKPSLRTRCAKQFKEPKHVEILAGAA